MNSGGRDNADKTKWDRFRTDLDRGLKKGMLTVSREGAVIKTRAVPSTQADRLRHKILDLKLKALRQLAHLGARVYSLMDVREGNPRQDASVKDITARIRRYETEIDVMEKQLRAVRNRPESRA